MPGPKVSRRDGLEFEIVRRAMAADRLEGGRTKTRPNSSAV